MAAGGMVRSSSQEVRAFFRLAGDVAADEVAELEDQGQLNGINHAVAVLAASNQTSGGKDAELFGHVGLFEARLLDEVANAGRSGLENLENAQPAGFRQDVEQIRHRLQLGGGQRFVRRACSTPIYQLSFHNPQS